MIEVRCITDPADFGRLAPAWNALLASSRADTIFLTWEWLFSWWEVYGRGRQLSVVSVLEGDAPIAFLPLFVKTGDGLPAVKIARFLGSEGPCSDYLDGIVAPGREEEVYRLLIPWLAGGEGGWDVLELTDLPEDSPLVAGLRSVGEGVKVVEGGKCCPFIALPPSWDDFLMALSAKKRYEVRHDRRSLEKCGAVGLEEVADPDQLEQAMADMTRLHQDRLTAMGKAGSFSSESYLRFHAAVCRRFLAQGWLRVVFLTVAGERVAFRYQFVYGSRIYDYQTGFDTAWSRQSVGLVLLSHLIERAIVEGRSEFDFLRGDENYKYGWATNGERRLVDITTVREGVRGGLYRLRNSIQDQTKSAAKRYLPASVQDALKKVRGS